MRVINLFRQRKQVFHFIFLFTAVTILSVSCQKKDGVDNDNLLTAEAKSWVSANLENSENRVSARVANLSKKLDWSQAGVYSAGQQEYAVVPLQKDDLKLENNYFMKRVFVFYKKAGTPIQMQLVELLTKGQPAANPVELAAALFEKKTLSKKMTESIQDVQAFFYDKQYRTVDAYEVRDNQWKPLQARSVNKPDEQLTADFDGGSGECTQWGVYIVTRDQYGNVLDEQLIYTYWVGDCSGGGGAGNNPNDSPGETMGGGESEEYDLHAEAALITEVLSTTIYPLQKNVSYTSETLADVPFQWIVVKNTFDNWRVTSYDVAEGYNSSNTGSVIYRIRHLSSSISGQTWFPRIRRDGTPAGPLIQISWSESSSSTSIETDYKSGRVAVSGYLKNLGFVFKPVDNFCIVSV